MKVNLELNYPGRFQWSQHENIHFIGYCFNQSGQLFQKAEDWAKSSMAQQIEESLGSFAAIELLDNQVTIWMDTAAAFPLFYKINNNIITISHTPSAEESTWSDDVEAYTRIYCTEGENTLLTEWESILAGHKLVINLDSGEIQQTRYFDHFVSKKRKLDSDFEDEFVTITQNWAKQIIEYAAGKQIWVPLSGGYDCRLLLSALIQAGAPNLHSYTYGRADSPEIQMAQQVAEKLEFSWYFIPYDEKAFENFFTDNWKEYALQNHHFQAVPHEQDYFALLDLSKKGILEPDFIAITGHCGEIPAGSVLKSYPIQTADYITEKYSYKPQYYIQDSSIEPWDAFHQWLSENRLSKFIVNSLRLFEYFGGKWMLPMWHRDFMELFYSLEFQERWEEKAYIDLSFKHYFIPLGIDFRKPKGDTISASKTYKDYIKAILPKKIVREIRLRNMGNPIADPCNLHVLYNMLYAYMKKHQIAVPERDGDLNRLHAFYMLHLLKE